MRERDFQIFTDNPVKFPLTLHHRCYLVL